LQAIVAAWLADTLGSKKADRWLVVFALRRIALLLQLMKDN
jgi:hypothetical protein